jgi:hypothetical protein
MISSPAETRERANVWATRLIPSVELRVKTIELASGAFRNRATFTRASSYWRVARSDRTCTPRWMLALSRS